MLRSDTMNHIFLEQLSRRQEKIPQGFVTIYPVKEYNTDMSIVIFLDKHNKLEATADRYAYDRQNKEMVLYEKLFNLKDKFIIGFASECMSENDVEHYRLLSESVAKSFDSINEFVEALRMSVFREDTQYFRRPDCILIGGYDTTPRIIKLTRENHYDKLSEITNGYAFIGWIEGLEKKYKEIKVYSKDIALDLIQDRCNKRPDLFKGIPRRFIVDKNGVQEEELTQEMTPNKQSHQQL